MLFFEKTKKIKKHLKTAAYFSFHNASAKIKKIVNFCLYLTKIFLMGTGFFSKFFHIEKTTKVKPTFVLLLL